MPQESGPEGLGLGWTVQDEIKKKKPKKTFWRTESKSKAELRSKKKKSRVPFIKWQSLHALKSFENFDEVLN